VTTWSYITTDEGDPVPMADNEEREYRAYAERLGIEPGAPAAASPRLVLMPAVEVERLRAMAALKPDGEEELYDRYARLAGVRR